MSKKKLEWLLNTYHSYKYGGLWNWFLIYFGLKDSNLFQRKDIYNIYK
jgi:hypothetical protein